MKKRFIALVMACVMCVPFAACGKKSEKEEKVDQYNAVQQAVIEHSLDHITMVGEALYGIYSDYDMDKATSSSSLVKYDLNTKDVSEVKITDDDMYIDRIYLNDDAQLVLSGVKYIYSDDGFEDDAISSGEDISDDDDQNDLDGTIEEDDTYTYSTVEYIYDTDLNQVSVNESETITESYNDYENDDELLYGSVKMDEDITVSLYQSMMDNKSFIKIKDATGNEKSVIELDNYAYGIYGLDSGKVLCNIYEDSSEYLYEVDVENGKLGQQIVDVSKYNINDIYTGKDDEVFFISSQSLFKCDCNTGKITKILNFMDCDINPDNVKYLFQLEDGTFGVVVNNSDYTKSEIDYLYKQDDNAKAKSELTVGVLYMDDEFKEKVIDYNKSHSDVRIVVKEYYGDDEDDYDNAMSKFNADIASGNCPDIIEFGSTVSSIEQYAEKGLIEDLTTYFEKDEEINLEDFVQSVVEAYKINNKLYVLPNSFMIMGYIGATSTVGKEKDWTVDEFIEFVNSFESGTEVLPYSTREGVIATLCSCNMNQYVDWTTGECYFDKGDFAKILEFSGTLMSDEDYWNQYDDENYVSDVTKIRNKQQILYSGYIYGIDDYMMAKAIYGEDITFKGYPSSDSNGIIVGSTGNNLLAISSKSKYKDEAWEFIRQFYLPEEYDSDSYMYDYSFPIRQDELDKMLEQAKVPETYIDENGEEQILYSEWGFEDVTLQVPYPTDEDIDNIKDIINSISSVESSNDKIVEIINEETEAFYSGQKTAEDVAAIIQSRVSVYVKENR